MKQRSIPKMFLLEVVTLGLYRLYWFIKTRKELMERTKVSIPSPAFLAAPILLLLAGVVIFVASLAGSSDQINKYDACMANKGFPASTSSTSYSTSYSASTISQDSARKAAQKQCDKEVPVPFKNNVLPVIIFYAVLFAYMPLTAWWFWHYCLAVEKATGEKVSRMLGMILLLVVPDGIDILILQDYYNKVR